MSSLAQPTLHSSSSTCYGRLSYGVRCLRPGTTATFRNDFEAWLSRRPSLSVALAFPDASDADRLHLLFWDSNAETKWEEEEDFVALLGPESGAFAEQEEDDADTVFHVYSGSGGECGSVPLSSHSAASKVHWHASLAGFMRPGRPQSLTRPLVGVFRRAIHPGRRDDLAKAFQKVCDIWNATVPGILAAFVTPDGDDDRFVYDVRIFADKASYDAHVDKSNAELTAAMEEWFSHYDTSVPHKGVMVAEDTSDPAMRTSSIKKRPVKVDFNVFHYGQGGCMGRCLDANF